MFLIFVCLFLVHGNWGQWTESACTTTCGGGTYTKTRNCSDPSPEHGGNECALGDGSGDAMNETLTGLTCNTAPCPG